MRRALVFPIVPICVALLDSLLIISREEQGFLPEAHLNAAVLAIFHGVLLACVSAWDFGRHDRVFLRATAARRGLFLVYVYLPGLASAVGTWILHLLLTWIAVMGKPVGGHPWAMEIISIGLWDLLSVTIGWAVAKAAGRNRRIFATIAAGLLAAILGWGSGLAAERPFPFFLLRPGHVFGLVRWEPDALACAASFVVVIGVILWSTAYSSPSALRRVSATGLLLVCVGSFATCFIGRESMKLRSAEDAAICIGDGMKLCGFPEQKAMLREAAGDWGRYIQAMRKLDIETPQVSFGPHGIGADVVPDGEINENALTSEYSAPIFQELTEYLVKKSYKCGVTSVPEEPTNRVPAWSRAVFGEDSPYLSPFRFGTPENGQWVEQEVFGKPYEEQLDAIEKYAESATCADRK